MIETVDAMLARLGEGETFETTGDEFALVNGAANKLGLMALVTRIDRENDHIEFSLVRDHQN